MANLQDVLQALGDLSNANMANNTITDVARSAKIYLRVLKDIPADLLDQAVLYYTSSERFFPSPGGLRDKAIELYMLSLDIPTEGEAWAQLNAPYQQVEAVLCAEGERLYIACENVCGKAYWDALDEYHAHKDSCPLCTPAGLTKNLHPLVREAVRNLGGTSNILTTKAMAAADRARFQREYQRLVEKKLKIANMPAETRLFVADQRAALDTGERRAVFDRGVGEARGRSAQNEIRRIGDVWGSPFARNENGGQRWRLNPQTTETIT